MHIQKAIIIFEPENPNILARYLTDRVEPTTTFLYDPLFAALRIYTTTNTITVQGELDIVRIPDQAADPVWLFTMQGSEL